MSEHQPRVMCQKCKSLFDADDWMVNVCPLCARKARWLKLCPPDYQETDPARISCEKRARVLSWTYGRKGLLLVGPTRGGKTRLASGEWPGYQRGLMSLVLPDCAGHELKGAEE